MAGQVADHKAAGGADRVVEDLQPWGSQSLLSVALAAMVRPWLA